MHLQKQLNRVVDGKEYGKYLLVIPPETVQELDWKEGEELDHEVKDQTLLIRKASESSEEIQSIGKKYTKRKRK